MFEIAVIVSLSVGIVNLYYIGRSLERIAAKLDNDQPKPVN